MASWDPGRVSMGSRLKALARLVRVEHTLFSLPFAYVGALLSGYPCSPMDYVWITLALLGLRTAAMSYNNIADLDIDRLNPRSMRRPLVVGAVTLREAWLLVALGSALYYFSAAMLNPYALLLSPIVWLVAMTYPHAKRVHWVPHLHLGLTLGLAVLGGAVAASGDEARSLAEALLSVPWVYVAAVTLWVAGFDTVYSIMDEEFDRRHGLGSIPARLGTRGALLAATAMHVASATLLLAGGLKYGFGPAAWASTLAAVGLMSYQNLLVWRRLSEIPRAFNLNLAVGLLVSLGLILDLLAS